jgi:hypothetical protein
LIRLTFYPPGGAATASDRKIAQRQLREKAALARTRSHPRGAAALAIVCKKSAHKKLRPPADGGTDCVPVQGIRPSDELLPNGQGVSSEDGWPETAVRASISNCPTPRVHAISILI